MLTSTLVTIAVLAAAADARPTFARVRRASFTLANGQAAIALNDQFKSLTATSDCTAGTNACVTQQFAQCVGGKFTLQPCAGGTICAALPLVNSAGTSITCTTQSDLDARIAATGATDAGAAAAPPAAAPPAAAPPAAAPPAAAPPAAAPPAAAPPAAAPPAAAPPAAAPPADNAAGAGGDGQTSTTLLASVIMTSTLDDGQTPPVNGQTASLTSPNNFINYCATTLPATPLTNGLQISSGSCNPIPMGSIPSSSNMPSAKFNFPKNTDVIDANVPFNASLNVLNFQTGSFTNAQKTYFGAPQQLNAQGQVIGHTHIVMEALTDLAQIAPTNPQKFLFFKGIDPPAVNGEAIALVSAGVPAGAYRMCSINTSANHVPIIGPVAQHGSFDDCVYFTAK